MVVKLCVKFRLRMEVTKGISFGSFSLFEYLLELNGDELLHLNFLNR